MKEEGLCDAIGLAAGTLEVMMPLLKDWEFDALITHNRFTLVNRNAAPMLDFAASKGIAVLNAAPYAGGVLAKGTDSFKRYVYQEATAEMLSPVRRVEAACAKHGVPPGAVALQFLAARSAHHLHHLRRQPTGTGARDADLGGMAPIPDALWDELKALPYATDDPEATREYSAG